MIGKMTVGIAALAILALPGAALADEHGHGHDNRSHEDRGDEHDDHGNHDRGDTGGNNGGYNNGYNGSYYGASSGDHHDNGRHEGQYKHQYQKGNWESYRYYDVGRPAPGYSQYYANQFYRDGSHYQPRRISQNERIYRGQDNRYYCRRSDGTTGLIIGGISGGVLGSAIAPGGSQTLGALLGGSLGAILGHSIDSGNVTCR